MMSVIVAMMLVVGMLGCSKESGEGDTSKEKSTKEGYKFGFTEWAAGLFFSFSFFPLLCLIVLLVYSLNYLLVELTLANYKSIVNI